MFVRYSWMILHLFRDGIAKGCVHFLLLWDELLKILEIGTPQVILCYSIDHRGQGGLGWVLSLGCDKVEIKLLIRLDSHLDALGKYLLVISNVLRGLNILLSPSSWPTITLTSFSWNRLNLLFYQLRKTVPLKNSLDYTRLILIIPIV